MTSISFRRNKSTITNLLHFQTLVSDALSDGSNVDVIYTDFTKAFDKLNTKSYSLS